MSVQPALPSYSCRGLEILDFDTNTSVVWNGGARTANGTVTFDLTDALILSGVQGQRVCASVMKTVQVPEPVCVAQAPILGYDPSTCPLIRIISGVPLASAMLTVPPPPPPPPAPAPPSADAPDPSPAAPSLTQKQKLKRALRACAKKKTAAKRRACKKAARKRYGSSSH